MCRRSILTLFSVFQSSVATLGGGKLPGEGDGEPAGMEGRKVLHTCDPQCDAKGCYGKGPTQCVACKHFRLDK